MRVLICAALLALAPLPAGAANMCAMRPLMPPVTYPCVRLVPQCVCDGSGNCHWVFFCEMS